MPGSVPFDRAAAYYDRTRGMSEDALAGVVRVLAGELSGRRRCVEVGVGTGMLALPLARAGVPLAGLDLSRPMLERLLRNAGGRPFPLVQGDAVRLPFADRVFGGALLRHVLHLIPAWPEAVEEAMRVVAPGGSVVIGQGHYPGPYEALVDRFVEEAGVARPWAGLPPGEWPPVEDRFGPGRPLDVVQDHVTEPLRVMTDGMREGLFSFTWDVPEDERRAATERVEAWAERDLEPLDQPATRVFRIELRAYDV